MKKVESGSTGAHETYETTMLFDELNRKPEEHIRGLNGNSIDREIFYRYDSTHYDHVRCTQDAEGRFVQNTRDNQPGADDVRFVFDTINRVRKVRNDCAVAPFVKRPNAVR